MDEGNASCKMGWVNIGAMAFGCILKRENFAQDSFRPWTASGIQTETLELHGALLSW